MGTNDDRINTLFGHGRMAAFAVDGDAIYVGVGACRTVFDIEDAGFRGGKEVMAVDVVKVVKVAGSDHFCCSTWRLLFGVLEDGVYFAAKFVNMVVNVLAGCHEDGGMSVVTAGVHDAIVL